MNLFRKCDECGNKTVYCEWKDCSFPHFCYKCRRSLPAWHEIEGVEQETNVGFPCWVIHLETQTIQWIKHHPSKSNVKVAYSYDHVIVTRNDTIFTRTLPLPDYPDSEQLGRWILKKRYDLHPVQEPSREEYLEGIGSV